MRAKLALLLLLSLMLGVSCQMSPSPTHGEDSATDQMSAILDQLLAMRRQVDLLSGMPSTLSTVLNRLSDIENGLTELKASQTLMKEKMKEVDKTLQAHNAMTAALNQNCCKLHTVESSMTVITNKVDSLASKVDTLTFALNGQNNTVVLLAADIKTLSSKVCDLTSKTHNLTHIVSIHDSQTSTLNVKLSSLDSQVDSLINTTDSILSHTGPLTSKADILNSSVKVLTNTITPLLTQVDILTSTVEGVRVGQLTLQQVIEEVKANLSFLQSKANTQANTTTALTTSEESTTKSTCNKTVELLNTMFDSQQLHLSKLPIPNSTLLSSCQQLAEDYPSAPSGYYWVRHHGGSPVSSYCIMTSQQNPASSCQQIAQDHPQGASGYYWVRDGTNHTVSSYCIITSQLSPACSCQQLTQDHPQGTSGYYWVREGTNNTVSSYCIISSQLNLASSCQQLAQDHPQGASGYYWVRDGTGQPIKVYCDMEKHCCNSTGGWMRVAYVDMTDSRQECPSGLHLRTDRHVRSCRIARGCTSITFPSHSIEYSRVCGRVRAYQNGRTWGFHKYYQNTRRCTIDHWYVYGVSITHGSSPRKHIWTFAAARSEYYSDSTTCPCTRTDQNYTGVVPPFIGEDYFCDTAVSAADGFPSYKLYTNDPLWDGQKCGPTSTCCFFNSPPWFCKQLPEPVRDDIELRTCGSSEGDTPFDQVELYIQ